MCIMIMKCLMIMKKKFTCVLWPGWNEICCGLGKKSSPGKADIGVEGRAQHQRSMGELRSEPDRTTVTTTSPSDSST